MAEERAPQKLISASDCNDVAHIHPQICDLRAPSTPTKEQCKAGSLRVKTNCPK